MKDPFCIDLYSLLLVCSIINIGSNIGNGLNFVMCEPVLKRVTLSKVL